MINHPILMPRDPRIAELEAENKTFRAAQKACETCDAPTLAKGDVCALRAALTTVMRYPGIREYLGSQVSDIADAALAPNAEFTERRQASGGMPGSAPTED